MASSINMMDSLTKLGLFPGQVSNATFANSTGGLPPGFMDTVLASAGQASPLLQLVLFVHRQLGEHLGIDPSLLLTTLGLLWGAQYFAYQIWNYFEVLVEWHLMCFISVSQGDSIYNHLMEWLSKQPSLSNNRYLMAQTVWKSAWEEDDDEDGNGQGGSNLFWTDAGGQGGEGRRYLNFSNQAARSTPRFVPAMGSTRFWYNRTYFKLTRKKDTMVSDGWQAMKDQEEIRIYCYGRSIAPIKRLLLEAKIAYYHDTHHKTTIYRPRQKEHRREYYSLWQQVARRPVRPMDTVVLDSQEKHNVLADINEYLHPSTPRWYASRGIPLRRGYLFYGPPGTGKTSFSFALAGVFGIDIYVISLQDVSVTEEDLAALFTKLPRRCIVLLEDIDTAGLRRDDDDDDDTVVGNSEKGKAKEKENDTNTEAKVNGERPVNSVDKDKKHKDKKTKKPSRKFDSSDDSSDVEDDSDSDCKIVKQRKKKHVVRKRRRDGKLVAPESISLSGLLNAIDGVASHEGRVLILTTNKPETLDEALVRPGRVDRQVSFDNATSDQAGELFHRMYERRSPQQLLSNRGDKKPVEKSKTENEHQFVDSDGDEKPVSPEELKTISHEFGSAVPDKKFSPAEIQGFLLKRKKSPRKALAEAKDWIEATLKQKDSKSKISTVQ